MNICINCKHCLDKPSSRPFCTRNVKEVVDPITGRKYKEGIAFADNERVKNAPKLLRVLFYLVTFDKNYLTEYCGLEGKFYEPK